VVIPYGRLIPLSVKLLTLPPVVMRPIELLS